MPELTEVIDGLGSAFEQFKADNDKRLKEIESKGHSDPLLSEKVERIANSVASLESLKQQVERNAAFESQLKNIETVLARPLTNGTFEAPKGATDPEYTKAFWGFVRHGEEAALKQIASTRAWNITTGSDGGYGVPEEIDREILSLQMTLSPIRQYARQITLGTSDYKKLVNTHGLTTEWVGETTANATDESDFAQVDAVWGQLSCRPQITQQMLDDVFFNAEAELIAEIARTFAQGEGTAFVTGNGTNKPKGFMGYTMASTADGTRAFGQVQYYPTGTGGAYKTPSATVSPADDLVKLLYLLKPYHRANAVFGMNATELGTVMTWKNYDGDYLWKPGIAAGQPSTILGRPVVEIADMDTLASDKYPIVCANFQEAYYILDRAFGIRTLRDPYTAKPYVEFYTTKRVGGMLVDSEAIKVLKASST